MRSINRLRYTDLLRPQIRPVPAAALDFLGQERWLESLKDNPMRPRGQTSLGHELSRGCCVCAGVGGACVSGVTLIHTQVNGVTVVERNEGGAPAGCKRVTRLHREKSRFMSLGVLQT